MREDRAGRQVGRTHEGLEVGGGPAPCDERAVFTAVVYALTSGCAWRHLPPTFGMSPATAHRRFTVWTEAGLWRRAASGAAGRTRGPGRGGLDLGDRRRGLRSRQKGGSLTGPNPVDRGKKGSMLRVLSVAQGIRLAVAVSDANMHDSLALKPLVRGIPAVRSRRGPRRRRPVKLRADKAYFSAEHLAWLRERGLVARIARPGIESGARLGRHRWKSERSIAWLFGHRRLTVRYERKGSHFLALLGWPPP
ncbi:IS5 family transposase [Streptomyces sp. NBC_00878]|uniref:IS5 family transposase n=1 Tax=Streptomyces sp. NBC_00878 TaxID=2975854 RepID=UPI00224D0FA4|nr:IS5 family transposase [Streptomyces sp. NBC_00878]MCX4909130.1 IS5 family transposase [Streptomyces sp. NBC_00878]